MLPTWPAALVLAALLTLTHCSDESDDRPDAYVPTTIRQPDRDAGAGGDAGEICAVDAERIGTTACEFPVPEQWRDAYVDLSEVNVTVLNGGRPVVTIGRVDAAGDCAGTRAWHYDAPTDPSRIILCAQACDYLFADPDRHIELLLGCEAVCGTPGADCEVPPGLPPLL